MNLKPTDYKLLSYLYHNYDEPLSKIAKATKLSRDQVEYRINKYLKEGLIRKFFPIFDWSKLGYNTLAILLLKFEKPKMAEDFSKILQNNKNCMSYGKIYGKIF
jgi:Lrp/AsnC family transcriptional regulator for asnA, asnC and gidA